MTDFNPHMFVTKDSITKEIYRDVYPQIDPGLPALSQKGKVVLITGASRGLGKLAYAASFAKANASAIIITARKAGDLKSTEELIKSINPTIEVMTVSLEISNETSVKRMFQDVGEKYSKVDVLVNNAGVLKSANQTLADGDVDAWWGDIETNVKGSMLVARHWLRQLGPERKGTYIGLSSLAATMVLPGMSGYALSKLGDAQLAAYIAVENPNVSAFAYHPGMVITDMAEAVDTLKPFSLDTPELSGNFAVWLATESASFLNGRYVSPNWPVHDLVAMKETIAGSDALKVRLGGQLVEAVVVG